MTFVEFYKKKEYTFNNSDNITVEITDIDIVKQNDSEWRITFRQYYQAGTYSDLGEKTLIIKNISNSYKIIYEAWQEIAN